MKSATRYLEGLARRGVAPLPADARGMGGAGLRHVLGPGKGERSLGRKPEGWPGNEIGWSFHPDAWGRGYATEAGAAAIDWAFDNLGWDDVIHCIHPENRASQRLAERFGSRNKGPAPLPAPYEDSPNEVWGQSRAEWRARRDAATP